MKKYQLLPVLLTALVLSACSPRVAQPPPLEELEPPMGDEISTSDAGPTDYESLDGATGEGWPEFKGDEPLTTRPTGDFRKDPALETVYFDYNKYDLKEESRRVLLDNAEYLKQNPKLQLLLEGHCDERGTEQYNQGLGENRSLAVREYLIQLGIPAQRIQMISYGELMPSVEGHNESAWRWNRRAEYKVAG